MRVGRKHVRPRGECAAGARCSLEQPKPNCSAPGQARDDSIAFLSARAGQEAGQSKQPRWCRPRRRRTAPACSAHVLRRSREPRSARGRLICWPARRHGQHGAASKSESAAVCLRSPRSTRPTRSGAGRSRRKAVKQPEGLRAATASSLRSQARPNTSVNARPNGGPAGPRSRAGYHRPRGPAVPPLGPRYLER